jgi:hypothetical protein
VANGLQIRPIRNSLDSLRVPEDIRWVFPVVKGAASIGLLSVSRLPWLARLTTAMLMVYFVLAVGAHIRVRDRFPNVIPATAMLALVTAMTVKGPRPESAR